MQNLVIKKSQLITAKFRNTPAANQKIYFDDIPEINRDNILVYGIEAYTADQVAQDESGNTLISSAGAKSLNLTLVVRGNDEEVQQIPVTGLIRSNVNGFYTLLNRKCISLTQSYITTNSGSNLSQNQVVQFNLYYVDKK